MNVLINLTMVIISPCTQTSNHHIAHFKYIKFYLSIKKGERERKEGRKERKEGRKEGRKTKKVL